MIYIDQSQELRQAMEKLKKKPHFQHTVRSFESKGLTNGEGLLKSLSSQSFQISGKDTVKLELDIDVSRVGRIRDQVILASILAKSMDDGNTRSVSHSIQSRYSAPPNIEDEYKRLAPEIGQKAAMKACTSINHDGKPFSWKDAEFKGFSIQTSMKKGLQGFDSKIIAAQKTQLSRQLTKNLAFHIDNTLEELSVKGEPSVKNPSSEHTVGLP